MPMFGVLELVAGSHLSTFQIYSMDNAQCQVFLRNRVSASGLLLACISGTEQVQALIPQLRLCTGEFCTRVPRLSFLYNLGAANLESPLYNWDFQSPSYALQSVLQRPRFYPGLSRLERNNLKLLNAFLFTPTLLNARIKVCYCKNEIFTSSRVDSGRSGRSKLSAKCETFKLTILNIASRYPSRCQGRSLHTKVNLRACNFKHCYPNYEG